MDLRAIFQLREKRFWWMDVIYYFAISLLIAGVFCYIAFLVKNNLQEKEIQKISDNLENIGTGDQKNQEKQVLDYKSKIADFAELFENHEFASNVLAFMQRQTMPNIWFKQFSLDKKGNGVKLSGESDNMDAFSRQISSFEDNEYVNSVSSLSSSIGVSSRIDFSINLGLDEKIFSYISDIAPLLETTTVADRDIAVENETGERKLSSEKLITVFHLLLNPEVIGTVDQQNNVITLDVPYGTDVSSLKTSIVISPLAKVSPASGDVKDFSAPVTYSVAAEDGSVQSYNVIVNVLPQEEQKKSGGAVAGAVLGGVLLLASVGIGAIIFFAWKKQQQKKKDNFLTK